MIENSINPRAASLRKGPAAELRGILIAARQSRLTGVALNAALQIEKG